MTTVIVINYHNEDLTIHFVKNELSKLDGSDFVVVVNNGATENSDLKLSKGLEALIIKDGVYQESKNGIYILSSIENLGFARGNNMAASFARENLNCDYFLFSNNDIRVVDSKTLDMLLRKYESIEKIGMIGPRVIGLKGELQSPEPYQSFWDRYVWMNLSKICMPPKVRRKRFNLDYSQVAREGFHYKVMGSFFLMSVKDFFDCGMMDPKTFLFCEEPILSERLKRIGKGVYYCPDTTVIHAHGATMKKTVGKGGVNRYMIESETYYYRHYKNVSSIVLCLGVMIHKLIMKLKRK